MASPNSVETHERKAKALSHLMRPFIPRKPTATLTHRRHTLHGISQVLNGGTTAAIAPVDVQTGQLGTGCNYGGEAYEGVLVRLSNVQILSNPARDGGIMIDDGSGATELQDDLLDTDAYLREALCGGILEGTIIVSLTGIVRYAGGSYEVHPRNIHDIEVRTLLPVSESPAGFHSTLDSIIDPFRHRLCT